MNKTEKLQAVEEILHDSINHKYKDVLVESIVSIMKKDDHYLEILDDAMNGYRYVPFKIGDYVCCGKGSGGGFHDRDGKYIRVGSASITNAKVIEILRKVKPEDNLSIKKSLRVEYLAYKPKGELSKLKTLVDHDKCQLLKGHNDLIEVTSFK